MKKHSSLSVFFLLLLSFVSSCLSEDGQKIALGNYPGVVVKRNDSIKIYLKGHDVVYSPRAEANVDDGDCVILDFSLDYSKPENADSGKVKGYLTIEITNITPVPSQTLQSVLTDTSSVLPNEHTLASIQERNAFILNRFFLYSEHRSDTLPLRFNLSYDPSLPRMDKTYDLFLRVSKITDEGSGVQPNIQFNAFDLTDLSRNETDSLFFRINYVQGFNKDSTQINWSSTPVYRFSL
ncbi:MAG: hypothetical protein LBQ65_08615 [Tannerellaceae bacterium]|nr:hypothetical protein [Tannerellaceae bacterium]